MSRLLKESLGVPTSTAGKDALNAFDTAKALWAAAVNSGLVTAVLGLLGAIPLEGKSLAFTFTVQAVVWALRNALLMYQQGTPPPSGEPDPY